MIWKDEIVRLRPAITGPPLRVGVWLEAEESYPWIRQAILDLRQAAGVEVVAVFFEGGQPESAPFFFRRYRTKCAARLAQDDDPFLAVDVRPALEGVPVSELGTAPTLKLDVLVRLSMRPAAGECGDLARYGVWSVGFGDPERYPAEPAYFWEIPERDAVSALLLYVHRERLEEAQVIYRYESATRSSWNILLNSIEPLSMAPVIITRRLRDLQQYGWEWLIGMACGDEKQRLSGRIRYPGVLELGWLAASKICSGLFNRLRRSEPKWFVCLRRKKPDPPPPAIAEPTDFTPVPNRPGSTFADPFLLEHLGKTYLFVEEIVTDADRGHLLACEVNDDATAGKFFEILREPYHLSYPCLFRADGRLYLLPETAANRTVDLYREVVFPNRWKLEKTLVEGIILVDTTPLFYNDSWYFFTSTVEEISGNWLETWLFYSDRLEGDWQYHPRNPICSDVRRARSAGHLFYRNGKLIRPAQDCSLRYGYALTFNEVLKLSPTEYEEKPVDVIRPDWMRGIFATHTWNASEHFEAIDATRIPE